MIIVDYLKKYLSEIIINVDSIPDEILLKVFPKEVRLIEQVIYDIRKTAIIWSIEDFEDRALNNKGENWRDFYDETKFQEALESMIEHHDAEYGIGWLNVDWYLNDVCFKKEVENEID